MVIGLGGCGGRSIRELRRTMVRRCEQGGNLCSLGANIDYLYLDAGHDAELAQREWNDNGVNLSLPEGAVINLDLPVRKADTNQFSQQPHIAPWLGDMNAAFKNMCSSAGAQNVNDVLKGIVSSGQWRRYGRVLFAMNNLKIAEALSGKMNKMISPENRVIHVHLFASLGGGIGSGTLIDTITLIQAICKEEEAKAVFYIYAYVGGEGASMASIGFFYENQYCTLRDLHALMIQAYQPDVIGMPGYGKYDLPTPVAKVCFGTDIATTDLRLPDQIANLAESCYASIAGTQPAASGESEVSPFNLTEIPHWAEIVDYLENRYRRTVANRAGVCYFSNLDSSGDEGSQHFSRPSLPR